MGILNQDFLILLRVRPGHVLGSSQMNVEEREILSLVIKHPVSYSSLLIIVCLQPDVEDTDEEALKDVSNKRRTRSQISREGQLAKPICTLM